MTEWLTRLLRDTTVLSPSEVVLVLLLGTSALFLFVAGALAGGAVVLRSRKDSRQRARSDRARIWQAALHEVLYDGAENESLWEKVEDETAVDFLHFLVQYARRLEGHERGEICALASPYLAHISPYLLHRSETRRARAVQMLGELGLPERGNEVIAALDDPSPMVAMVAASTLARTETPEFAEAVLSHLGRFGHWRQDFLVAMVASMGDRAAPALRGTLVDSDAPTKVRAVAADALASVGDPLAADPAFDVLITSSDIELRAATVRLLASVGRAKHLDAVREGLEDKLPVRLASIRALGRFGLTEDIAPLEHAAKEDPSPWVAIAAARALKQGGGQQALEALAGSDHPRAALGLQVIAEARSW